jgi:hypothetical protein
MNKNKCKVGQKVAYFPQGTVTTEKVEFGVITELRDNCAMILYEGDKIAKSTYYSDIEVEPVTLTPVGKSNN